jgi:hypothetical protein
MEVVMNAFFPFIYEPEKKMEPEQLYIEIEPPRFEPQKEHKDEEEEPSPRIIIIQL